MTRFKKRSAVLPVNEAHRALYVDDGYSGGSLVALAPHTYRVGGLNLGFCLCVNFYVPPVTLLFYFVSPAFHGAYVSVVYPANWPVFPESGPESPLP